mmetsp:Transcript_19496/g.27197  ORF Transcript_19496/g.27197 Transcript_19496/m.27197 type:complete len:205 (-) Transcript_19496:76-690(-)
MPKQDNTSQKDSKKRPRQVPLSGKMKLAKHIEPVRNHQEAQSPKSSKGIPFTSKFNVKTMDSQMRSRSPSSSPLLGRSSPVDSSPNSRRSSVGYNPPGSPLYGSSPPHDLDSLVPQRSSGLTPNDLQILCLLAASQEVDTLSKRAEELRAASNAQQALKQLQFDLMNEAAQQELAQSAPSTFDTQQYLNLLRDIQRNAEMMRSQ